MENLVQSQDRGFSRRTRTQVTYLEERIPSLGFSSCMHRLMQKRVAGDRHDIQHLFQQICFHLFYILGFCNKFHLEKGYQLRKFIVENLSLCHGHALPLCQRENDWKYIRKEKKVGKPCDWTRRANIRREPHANTHKPFYIISCISNSGQKHIPNLKNNKTHT